MIKEIWFNNEIIGSPSYKRSLCRTYPPYKAGSPNGFEQLWGIMDFLTKLTFEN